MALRLYNTLTRKKELFKPISKGKVGLYTCGPTVYWYAHIGNLRTFLFEDVLRRVLEYANLKVRHVMNITDVGHLTDDADSGEEKMEITAKKEKKTVWDIAKFYTAAFKEDAKRLNLLPPHQWSKATDYIPEQIRLIETLEKKGFTYKTADAVYFDTSKFKTYGKLAKLKIKGLKAGARVKVVKGKKNSTDFALWKFSKKKRQMEWESPWGVGFPGWHIECSAMSMKFLGEHFDIHCGGTDHIPVHHTNEIAQSEAATGKKSVNYWLHGAFLVIHKDKMGKSKGNMFTLQSLIDKGYDPLDYRYLLLGAQYRTQLQFSIKGLGAARNARLKVMERIKEYRRDKSSKKTKQYAKLQNDFKKAIEDDLNMPVALAVMWDVIKSDLGNKEKLELLFDFDKVFGLSLNKKEEKISLDIKKLISDREKARKNGDFKRSDLIRMQLKKKGIIIEDTSKGTRWKKA
jgi:cysteinyl-tRNA synthetase